MAADRNRFRPGVESLETRLVPTAAPRAVLNPAPVFDAATMRAFTNSPAVDYGTAFAPFAAAATRSYQVVSFRNPTNVTVNFQFRWSSSEPWMNYQVSANGGTRYFYSYGKTVAPQIRFDSDLSSGGYNVSQSNVKYKTVTKATTPTYTDAFHYAFGRTGNRLTLGTSKT